MPLAAVAVASPRAPRRMSLITKFCDGTVSATRLDVSRGMPFASATASSWSRFHAREAGFSTTSVAPSQT